MLDTLKTSALLSVVPIKLVPGEVPEFPVRFQPDCNPSNLVLSAALILPAALVVAAEIEMTGAFPPDETIGAVPVTPVTVPDVGVTQLITPAVVALRTCPLLAGAAVGKVREYGVGAAGAFMPTYPEVVPQ